MVNDQTDLTMKLNQAKTFHKHNGKIKKEFFFQKKKFPTMITFYMIFKVGCCFFNSIDGFSIKPLDTKKKLKSRRL